MASATVDYRHHHRDNRLHLEAIPFLDLRLLSQRELLSLSLCSSSPSPSNAETELFTPKIDRSVFNESAGSRKQTFSRLRLAAPRNYLHHHHHHSSPSSKPLPSFPRRLNPQPPDEESYDILPLLKSLFSIDDSLTANTHGNDPEDDKDLVPVQIEYPTGNSVLQNMTVGIVSCSGGKRKRGRPRKDEKLNWLIKSEILVIGEHKDTAVFDGVNEKGNAGDVSSCSEKNRRARREESQSKVIDSEEKKVDSETERVAMANVEAILGIEEELRRRTEGMAKETELLEYMGGLEGEWAGKSQKKRIIDANVFGNVLPKGWKLMLFVKRRAGHVWLACSRYISPDGQQFVSCKEVSSYLLSFGGLEDSSQSTSSHIGCGIGSGVKPTSENLPSTCISSECKKQASLQRVGSPTEVQRAEIIKCHKCPMTFNQQDDFIGHLLSSHQGTAKTSGHGMRTNEEVITKNGKYECQFCYELFEERSCYTNHLGIHMKNNMMKDDGSVGVLTMQKSIWPFNSSGNNEMISDFPSRGDNEIALLSRDTDGYSHECNLLFHDEQDIEVNRNEKTLVDENCDKQNIFDITNNDKGEVSDNAAVELNVCLSSEKVLFTAENNGIPQSPDKTDVRFALSSIVKKREMAPNTSVLAMNAKGNRFRDENIEGRHFASKKGMATDFKDRFAGDDPKANCANACTVPDFIMPDIEKQNCFEDCSLILSSNEQRSNLVDHAKGASAAVDPVHERGSRHGLTSFKDDQRHVTSDNLTFASSGTLNNPKSIVAGEYGKNDSAVGFQCGHHMKKPSQEDRKSALVTIHGRDQSFLADNKAFKVSSQRVEVLELLQVQKSSGLIQDVDSHGSGSEANILASVRQGRNNNYLVVPSPFKKTFTCTQEERKQVKGSESSAYGQSANQQNIYNETSMNKVSFGTVEERKQKVESSLIGNAHARVGTFAQTGTTGLETYSPLFSGNRERFVGKSNVPGISSGTVHEPKQNKVTFEDLFCLSGREQTQVANSLNMIYGGKAHGESRLEDFENARNNEIMIGFGNHVQHAEDSMTGVPWKSDEGSVLLSGLADTSSQLLQSSGYYPSYDMMSHKGESEIYNISGKCSNISGFEELRPDSIEHMEYNFLSAQPSSRSGDAKVSSYDSEMALRCDSSIWFGKEGLPLLPKVAGRHQVTTMCSWCGNEFYNEAVDIGSQRNSMAVVCGSCRVRFTRNRDFL